MHALERAARSIERHKHELVEQAVSMSHQLQQWVTVLSQGALHCAEECFALVDKPPAPLCRALKCDSPSRN
jgi:hypothetical protein